MKKTLFLLVSTFFIYGCGSYKKANTSTKAVNETPANITEFASTITASELKEMLYTYASDEFEGRETAQPGQKKAVEYIKNHYVNLGISSPISKDNFFQKVPLQIVKTPKTSLWLHSERSLSCPLSKSSASHRRSTSKIKNSNNASTRSLSQRRRTHSCKTRSPSCSCSR